MHERYIIGTGYVNIDDEHHAHREEIMRHWVRNNRETANPRYNFVLSMFGSVFQHPDVREINVAGNIGSYDDLLDGRKPHPFCGASAALMTLALVAYADESDFIYKEQDVLAFGSWVDELYLAAGDGGIVLGPSYPPPSGVGLMLIRHSAIPKVVGNYLLSRPEHDNQSLMEHHFHNMAKEDPELFRYHSMGYDKRRPANLGDKAFFIHQHSKAELQALKDAKIL